MTIQIGIHFCGQIFPLRFRRRQLLDAPAVPALGFGPFPRRIHTIEFQFHAGHSLRVGFDKFFQSAHIFQLLLIISRGILFLVQLAEFRLGNAVGYSAAV